MEYLIINGELYHHGIKGQKWGIRRYQNEDGTLTDVGRKRYGESGADFLKAKRNLKQAKKNLRRAKVVGSIARAGLTAAGHPVVGGLAKGAITASPEANRQRAKQEYIKKRHDMLYETGKRKKLEGKYQTTGDDEAAYGYRGAKRIAKKRNKGLTREQAVRSENVRVAAKTIGSVAVAGLIAYDRATGGKMTKAAIKGGIKAAGVIAKGAKAAKKVYNNHYNMKVLDVDGKVIARYHDTFMRGEDVAKKLLHA